MKLAFLAVAALATVVAVQAQAQTPEEAANAAGKAYTDCQVQLAKDFDDHRSDAATIAHAIETGCSYEMKAWAVAVVADTYRGAADPRVLEQTVEGFKAGQFDSALRAVLIERRYHK